MSVLALLLSLERHGRNAGSTHTGSVLGLVRDDALSLFAKDVDQGLLESVTEVRQMGVQGSITSDSTAFIETARLVDQSCDTTGRQSSGSRVDEDG